MKILLKPPWHVHTETVHLASEKGIMMKITFLGAAHEVTGSCTLLHACGKNILIDCGMEQGPDIYENRDIPVAPGDIDCILLTHAHIDHSGKIPLLVANGFSHSIYATGATAQLCQIMLLDSAHIQESEAAWRNRKAQRAGQTAYTPLYTAQDVHKTMELFTSCDYNHTYDVCEGIQIRFLDAGHLLGSASIEIIVTEHNITKKILFSGDVGNVDRPLIRDPSKPEYADIIIIESTYGNRLHGERKDYIGQLSAILQQTFDRGGNVVIPAFAVGRTQELLYLIHEIKDRGMVKNHTAFPVWVDSPLAVESTRIYEGDKMEYYDEKTLQWIRNGVNVLTFKGLNLSVSSEESKAINSDPRPKVIISASGMCEAGRIRHHLKHNLWRRDSSILFVGYQAEGTLGRHCMEGAKTVKIFGEEIQVNAHIEIMEGISGHADKNLLLSWLGNLKNTPDCVYVNHGDDTVCDEFADAIRETLHFHTAAPYSGSEYDLITGACLFVGNQEKIKRKTDKQQRNVGIFEALLMAGKRLISIIEKHRGGSNKDLAKFTNQINTLCNKWEK